MFFRRVSAVLLTFLCAPLFADGFVHMYHEPVWPMAGTDADVVILPGNAGHRAGADGENIRIVSTIGADMQVENNINIMPPSSVMSFSGGANLIQSYPAAAGFFPFENQAELPFMHSEMLETDGAPVLAMSRTDRRAPDMRRHVNTVDAQQQREFEGFDVSQRMGDEPVPELRDQVRSWVVASGQTLRDVLQDWCDREGWDLVWNTPREYPIAASAVFKGRFMDVSAALVRNFSRASPIPHAKFYKGNRVLVISTLETE